MFNENKENIIYAKENSIILFNSYYNYQLQYLFFIERDFEKVKEVKNVEDSYDIEVEYDIEDIIYSDIDIVIKDGQFKLEVIINILIEVFY